jgi:protein-tyrosine phosphatase
VIGEGRRRQPRRILTVCKGGHCRAPLAAAVLAHHGGTAIETRAAAIRNWHTGEGAHPVMVAVAARHGYDLSRHRGVQVDLRLLEWADLVLAMDSSVLAALSEIGTVESKAKTRLYLDGRDVPDPWKRPEEAFAACLSAIEQGAREHLAPL